MNNVYFSASAAGFYSEHLITDGSYDDSLPSDVVELTVEETETYKGVNPPDGKMLGAIDGRPAWVDLPPPPHEELIASANAKKSQLKAVADSEISWRQDAVDGAYAEANEVTELAGWKKYRVLLMRIDTSKAPNITWPVSPDAALPEA
ncbi:tail fiber assembly protein [Yersinia enterocolitica]|uniref:tail fiber assembly protein n=1 Tax=Yersinia enterocolitica TaxID=630 RepID=UPI0028B6B1CC|nr:tail fiber assembly protein [Yersinia enterocolitica]EKN3983091.1 tail fiber assembly protein [Yersinia enterocolitica]ELI8405272.1 tail fiber assembly protein [Yersinia enterocolitica]